MKKIIYILLCCLIVVTLTSCQINSTGETYMLEYDEASGATVICDYPSGSSIKKGTQITIDVSLDGGHTFVGWFQNEKLVSSNEQYVFKITTDTRLTPKTKITSRITIGDLLLFDTDERLTFEGTVFGKKGHDIFVGDDTGIIMVQSFNSDNIEIGDVVTVSGKLSTSNPRYIYLGCDISLTRRQGIEHDFSIVTVDEESIFNYTSMNHNGTRFTLTTTCLYQNDEDIYYFLSAGTRFNLSDYVTLTGEYINQEIIVEGYFVGNSQFNEDSLIVSRVHLKKHNVIYISQLDKHNQDTLYTIEGEVVSSNERALLIRDHSGIIQVYLGYSHGFESGDNIRVCGYLNQWAGETQFGRDVTITYMYKDSHQAFIDLYIDHTNVENDATSYYLGQCLTVTGRLVKIGGYYNIVFSDLDLSFTISYYFNEALLDSFVDHEVIFTGFVLGHINNYVQIMGDLDRTKPLERLSVLSLNDLHGYINNGEYDLANIAYLINQIRLNNETVLIANGDMFQGTAVSNLSHGLSVLNIMNEMRFDMMGIGNHEFDWGLDKVLKYFDGNEANGEANFPLLNANIYEKTTDKLVSIEGGHIYESTIVVRQNVKIGLVSYIGNIYSSINYPFAADYYFDLDFGTSMLKIGQQLKNLGADIIIVNVHDGVTSSISEFQTNKTLANLKLNGQYIVDVIINGHTHYEQTGYINRNSGIAVPVIQARSYGTHLGEIILNIDSETKKITTTEVFVHKVSKSYGNYDTPIRHLIEQEIAKVEPIINENLTIANETVTSSSQLQPWIGSVLRSSANVSIGIANDGGIRSNGNIRAGEYIKYKDIYEACPFDNYIYIVELPGRDIYNLLNYSSLYYSLDNIDREALKNSSQVYKVAVIDYVYYENYFPKNETVIDTGIILRDALIEDLRLRANFSPLSNPLAVLNNAPVFFNHKVAFAFRGYIYGTTN